MIVGLCALRLNAAIAKSNARSNTKVWPTGELLAMMSLLGESIGLLIQVFILILLMKTIFLILSLTSWRSFTKFFIKKKPSIFAERVECIDLFMMKIPKDAKTVDASDITHSAPAMSGEMVVDFDQRGTHLFRLWFDFDPKFHAGIITNLKADPSVKPELIAAAIEKYLNDTNDVVSIRTGFGDSSSLPDTLSAYPFPSLVRIIVWSGNSKSVAITKSIAKLQECFVGTKFSLTRLS